MARATHLISAVPTTVTGFYVNVSSPERGIRQLSVFTLNCVCMCVGLNPSGVTATTLQSRDWDSLLHNALSVPYYPPFLPLPVSLSYLSS